MSDGSISFNHGFDVLVIGAGPAGSRAALTAASAGLRVGLLDEALAAGGQVWRAPPAAFKIKSGAKPGPDAKAGQAIRAELEGSGVKSFFGRRVWNLRTGFEAYAVGPKDSEVYSGKALILAPGTVERVVPFPGSTLPGVIGLGAATVLLKAQQMLPGRRTVVAGAGPLLAAVAVAILKGGGQLAAVVDLNGPRDWARTLPSMAARPDLLMQGLGWLKTIAAHRVPYFAHHAVVAAGGGDAINGVTIAPVDGAWRLLPDGRQTRFDVDALVVGHGLSPSTEMMRLLGAAHKFDPKQGEWIPVMAETGATSVAGLFVAGDAAGVSGAAAAVEAGSMAGLQVAHHLGAVDAKTYEIQSRAILKRLAGTRRFGRAMAGLTALRPGLAEAMPPQTVVCRCEDVTRAQIDAAAGDGAAAVGQLKAWTRCGMGPCQGRMCSEAVGALMAINGVPRETFGQMVARPPLRPVSIGALSGAFDYEDIALPPSLPSS